MRVCYCAKGESPEAQFTHFTCSEESAQLPRFDVDLRNTRFHIASTTQMLLYHDFLPTG
jgi:hypothetical protein